MNQTAVLPRLPENSDGANTGLQVAADLPAVDFYEPLLATSTEFEELFERLYEPQVRRAFLLVGSMPLAHDLVSDAFTAVQRRWDDLHQPERYLKRCVLNGCRDWGRSRSRWSRLVVDEFDQAALEQVRDTAVPFDRVDLADALAKLSYRQRAAIVLQFYGNESQESIADLLGCRRGTVGSLVHRGLSQLRAELG